MTAADGRLGAIAAVQARIADLASPPRRVAQLHQRFDALLTRAVSAREAPDAAPAAAPTGTADATTAPSFMSAASHLGAGTPVPAGGSSTVAAPSAGSSAGGWTTAPVLRTPRILTLPGASATAPTSGASALGAAGGPITPTAPRGGWVDRVPNQRGKDLAPYIQGVADRYGLDPALLAAVFWTESSYRADAVSSAGAVGLGQLMPGTAKTLGVDPRDPMQNMDGSARLYKYLIDKYGGSLDLAISAYACGEGAVARAGGVPSDFARNYIGKLLGRRDYLAGNRATPP